MILTKEDLIGIAEKRLKSNRIRIEPFMYETGQENVNNFRPEILNSQTLLYVTDGVFVAAIEDIETPGLYANFSVQLGQVLIDEVYVSAPEQRKTIRIQNKFVDLINFSGNLFNCVVYGFILTSY